MQWPLSSLATALPLQVHLSAYSRVVTRAVCSDAYSYRFSLAGAASQNSDAASATCPSPENAALVRSALLRLSRFVRVESRLASAAEGEAPKATRASASVVRLREEARAVGVTRVELRLRAQRPVNLSHEVACAREALTLTVADEPTRNRQHDSLALLGAPLL